MNLQAVKLITSIKKEKTTMRAAPPGQRNHVGDASKRCQQQTHRDEPTIPSPARRPNELSRDTNASAHFNHVYARQNPTAAPDYPSCPAVQGRGRGGEGGGREGWRGIGEESEGGKVGRDGGKERERESQALGHRSLSASWEGDDDASITADKDRRRWDELWR